jgi:hypothetical protein
MVGEPDDQALAEIRLQPATCQEVIDEVVEAEVKGMRADLDRAYQRWKQDQIDCWRRRWRSQHRLRPPRVRMGATGMGKSAMVSGGSVSGFGGGSLRTSRAKTATSASRTNTQVAGVDEADIVKHDGAYIYLAINGALRIVEALNPRPLSVTPLKGEARMLFVKGDRAVVYVAKGKPRRGKRCSYAYDCMFAGDGTQTEIQVFDVGNRLRPQLVRRLELSGSLMAARRIGNAVHTVVSDGDPLGTRRYPRRPSKLGYCDGKHNFIQAHAMFEQLKRDNEGTIRRSFKPPTIKDGGRTASLCASAWRTRIHDGRAFTSVVSFDLAAHDVAATTATIASRPGPVFASAGALTMSVPHFRNRAPRGWPSFYSSHSEISDLHVFTIGAESGQTAYRGSGVVPGRVLNQFSMDEWYGYLRIATTKGRAPSPQAESVVSILATTPRGNLVRVGAIEHIAPSEDIRSVRFDGDRGYVVTFKKTDPLFVLDLYHPAKPKILGELKIPGFSTYMHRIDRNHLLSIGFDADDKGSFAYFDGVILQLFDVSEPTNPQLIHKEVIGTRGSSSAATSDHLAFNYFDDRKLLAIPMTICEGGDDGRYGRDMTFSGLLVYDVSVKDGFNRRGGVNHGKAGATCGRWWTQSGSVVRRSIFMDQLVFSVATDRMKVQNLEQLGSDVADIALR